MMRFYTDPNQASKITPIQAKAMVEAAKLPIQSVLKEKLYIMLKNEPSVAKFIVETFAYLNPFYNKYSCDDLSLNCITQDLEAFYVILTVKKAYEKHTSNTMDFNGALIRSLGYLSELTTEMYSKKQNVGYYSPDDKKQNIYSRFFCDTYDEEIFETPNEFQTYRYGFESTKDLFNLVYDSDNNLTFSFKNENLIFYLYTLNPYALVEGKRKLIADFINENFDKVNDVTNNDENTLSYSLKA